MSDLSRRFRQRILPTAGRRTILYIYALLCIFPLYWILITSLKSPVDAIAYPPLFLFTPTLDNFKDAVANPDMWVWFGNSAIVAFGTMALSLAIGAPTAYILARFSFWGRGDYGFWILTTRMTPPVAMLIPFFVMYHRTGLLDTHLGLIIAHVGLNLSIVVWLLRGFFSELPREIEEAAYLDGDTYFQAFWRVTLPLAKPGMTAVGILVFLLSWNEFLFSLVLGGNDVRTIPVGLYSFIGYQKIEWAKLSASAVIVVIPLITFILIFQKQLIRGLTLGSYR